MAGLSLKNVTKYYQNGHVAVRDFTLDIADSEFVVLVGPEGCGRSTVLRMIAGLEDISSGELLIDGKRVNEEGTRERWPCSLKTAFCIRRCLSMKIWLSGSG